MKLNIGKIRIIFFLDGSPARAHNQTWMPVVANHFPAESPFTSPPATMYLLPSEVAEESSPVIRNPNRANKRTREVTFVNEVEKVSYHDD